MTDLTATRELTRAELRRLLREARDRAAYWQERARVAEAANASLARRLDRALGPRWEEEKGEHGHC